ncbi:MAG: hypothetical protein AAGB22_06740 [Bacteroidota bacterium]
MESRIARIISYALHPLFMPTLGLILVFQLDTYMTSTLKEQAYSLYFWVFTNTCIIPILITLLMLNRKYIQSLQMETLRERRLPFLFTGIFYFSTYLMLHQVPLPPPIYSLFLGASLSVVAALLISLRWKISIHMIGVSGLVGAVVGIHQTLDGHTLPYLLITLAFTGLAGFARLQLQAHNPPQVYAGALVGFLAVYLSVVSGIG